jgi:hypothetical protein
MKGANQMGMPAQHIDDTLDRQVEEYSKLYSIDQWLQPRRWVGGTCARLFSIVCTNLLWLMTCCVCGVTTVHTVAVGPSSMVQVQLAKLKEETRCPMCFGESVSATITAVQA